MPCEIKAAVASPDGMHRKRPRPLEESNAPPRFSESMRSSRESVFLEQGGFALNIKICGLGNCCKIKHSVPSAGELPVDKPQTVAVVDDVVGPHVMVRENGRRCFGGADSLQM